jgi:hypothetical protein
LSRARGKLPREIFLSHASKDYRLARRLAETLREHGLPVWYAPTEIIGAQQWHDEIGAALARCDWFVLVVSPNAAKSEWVRRELMYALNEARYREHIAPLIFRRCDPQEVSWTLQAFQHIDFTKGFARGCTDLLRVWGLGFRGD